jgi:Phage tail tube protein, GTA-gp10
MTMSINAANVHRGEIFATLDGVQRKLRLTLNVLAELEAAFEVDSLYGLIQKLTTTKLNARHLAMIVAAGLRGAGEDTDADTVGQMHCARGPAGFADIVRELLEASFGAGDAPASAKPKPAAGATKPGKPQAGQAGTK